MGMLNSLNLSRHPRLTIIIAAPHVAGLAAYLMSFQGVTDVDQVVSLMKSLAQQSGATVLNNIKGTTTLIANNGNL